MHRQVHHRGIGDGELLLEARLARVGAHAHHRPRQAVGDGAYLAAGSGERTIHFECGSDGGRDARVAIGDHAPGCAVARATPKIGSNRHRRHGRHVEPLEDGTPIGKAEHVKGQQVQRVIGHDHELCDARRVEPRKQRVKQQATQVARGTCNWSVVCEGGKQAPQDRGHLVH